MGQLLIILGAILIALGAVLSILQKYGWPRLPGDILIQKGNFTFFFPIATMLILSIVLTLIINLFRR